MPRITAGFQSRVYAAAAGSPIRRVISIGHDFEFLNGVDVGGDLPGTGKADRGAVQGEAVGAGDAAIHHIGSRNIPAARTGVTRRSELLLREKNAGSEI